ncbi:MAG: hypothetical protein ABL958_05905 [Bdellovibrionia bacterium]
MYIPKILTSLILALLLCACGGSLQMQSSVSTTDGGNAEGYPGGDEAISALAGRFYYQRPGYECQVNGKRIKSYKYAVEITKNSVVRVFQNGCSRRLIHGNESLRHLNFAAYNPVFFTKGGVAYTREGFTELDGQPMQVMALCRRQDKIESTGVDLVWVQSRVTGTNYGILFWGERSTGMYRTGSSDTIPLDVNVSSDSMLRTLTAPGLKLTIDSTIKLDKYYRVNVTKKGQGDLGSLELNRSEYSATEPVMLCSTLWDFK